MTEYFFCVDHKPCSSEKPLVTLGLVLDADGFPKRTEVFEGNVGEPGTPAEMITALSFTDMQTRPLIVMDAGIAAQRNILWLKEKGYGYIVVSRKWKIALPPDAEMIIVREDSRRLIRAALSKGPDDDEITLHFAMLTDIEDAFRSMKSELGLRPVYHRKKYRSESGSPPARKHSIRKSMTPCA